MISFVYLFCPNTGTKFGEPYHPNQVIPHRDFVICALIFFLQIRRNASSSSEESSKSFHLTAREYVESLHQNSKNTLLYGKNNVLVQPVRCIPELET